MSRLRPLPPQPSPGWYEGAALEYAMDMLFEEGWWGVRLYATMPTPTEDEPDPQVDVYCDNFHQAQRKCLSSLRPRWYPAFGGTPFPGPRTDGTAS